MTQNDTRSIDSGEAYTVEELRAMSDADFRLAVTDNIYETKRYNSPFQKDGVVERTYTALVDCLWQTNERILDRADDPNCSPEVFKRTEAFRRLLLSAIDATEGRINFYQKSAARSLSAWKRTLHSVIDGIMSGDGDDDILALPIPMPGAGVGETIDLATWWEMRRAKDPSRLMDHEKVAA